MSYYFEKNLASFHRFEGFPEGLLIYFIGREYKLNYAHLPELMQILWLGFKDRF